MKINWTNLLIIVALAAAAVGLFLPAPLASAPPVASTQSFQCAPDAMCVQSGGKVVSFPSGSKLTIDSGIFTATNFTANTITATTLVSQAVSFAGTDATLTNLVSSNGLAASGNLTVTGASGFTGDVTAGTVYVNGYLRSTNGPVTTFDPATFLKVITATRGIIINGNTYTVTDPITISGVISNVRLLYFQVP